jgi:hypothetical protein
MKDVQSFAIGSFHIYHLFCVCLHNNFIFCKFSNMWNELSNEEEYVTNIVMMVRVLSRFIGPIYART